jgi:hypothetical protein
VRAELPSVFLCGPLTGVDGAQAAGWRRRATEALDGIARTIDPTRDHPDLRPRAGRAQTPATALERVAHGKRTVARNRFDLERCDLVLACVLGARTVSIGAVGEIFWADVFRKPVIVVREPDNPHDHDMLNEIAGWIFGDLDGAIEQIALILGTRAAVPHR